MSEKDIHFEILDENRIIIPRHGKMRVDGIIYSNREMTETIKKDMSLVQVANVAHLPGIIKNSIAMPDIHWGYGFPIGGVAAFDIDEGIISPGGVGYDINCGVRLLRTDLHIEEIRKELDILLKILFQNIPTGLGSSRKDFRATKEQMRKLCESGAEWIVKQGFGLKEDLKHIEDNGIIEGADYDRISNRAFERGKDQIGTLGSGNHFVEVGYVSRIYDEKTAEAFGLVNGNVTVTIHTGSRGFGHQICTDFISVMQNASRKYGIELPDRQLCCAPIKSPEGRDYFAAMACAANYAFVNRQLITHWVRETFEKAFGRGFESMGINVVYDIAHNIAKFEEHEVGGKMKKVCVHRKGATRSLPANHPSTPAEYRDAGQPVLIPGDMGRYSYVLAGEKLAMEQTFGSACHGAGRLLSRSEAIRRGKGRNIRKELSENGILIMAAGKETLAEEMPDAYKDVSDVVNIIAGAGIARRVCKLTPVAVIKG
jgi:tRNA-splicing ligase RtcB